jgi:hypothetical protein
MCLFSCSYRSIQSSECLFQNREARGSTQYKIKEEGARKDALEARSLRGHDLMGIGELFFPEEYHWLPHEVIRKKMKVPG